MTTLFVVVPRTKEKAVRELRAALFYPRKPEDRAWARSVIRLIRWLKKKEIET